MTSKNCSTPGGRTNPFAAFGISSAPELSLKLVLQESNIYQQHLDLARDLVRQHAALLTLDLLEGLGFLPKQQEIYFRAISADTIFQVIPFLRLMVKIASHLQK